MKSLYFRNLLLFVFVFPVSLPLQLRAQSKLQQFDDQVLINLSETRTPEKTGVFLFISNHNDWVNIGVPMGLLTAGVINDDKAMRQNALYVASSSAVNVLFTMLLKRIVKRPRPFLANVKIKAVYQPSEYSFPSGHTSTAFTTATALSQAYPKWYVIAPSYLWAGAVGFSRLYLGVHYPTDVVAGAALGTGAAFSLRSLRGD
ncbi:MAG: phosphatase PAP2 family protein [Candidatus Pedobacter colombiensis]|uniref:Phosphatase PAP2 family protein n=1 Tax=Candidatus Pedobacter colombiensis TaxID=3121371 RepID=A0AAJ6B831_9SPHI|nr:phosphatase PAP2 family protein [Pedobacter sp.]WEK21752.1 MAG: phosphatase PAP2 family protein [Pedobacter sp.]